MTNLPAPNNPFSGTPVSENTGKQGSTLLQYNGPQTNTYPIKGASGHTYFFKNGDQKYVFNRDVPGFLERRHGNTFLFSQVDGSNTTTSGGDAGKEGDNELSSTLADKDTETSEPEVVGTNQDPVEPASPLNVTVTHFAQDLIDEHQLSDEQVKEIKAIGGSGSNNSIVKSDVQAYMARLESEDDES